MTDEHKPDQRDDIGDIEGRGPAGTGLKIPVRRSDVGPYVKWILISIAFAIASLAVGGAIRLVIGGL